MANKINCKKVAIAILGYNSKDFLAQFIPSVLATNYADCTVVYIDNASSDGSLELVKEHFPSIEIVALDKNYGFAGGYNKGLEFVEAKYYILLNQDVEVTPNWLDEIIPRLEHDETIGAVQPKILHYHNKNQFDYAGASGGYIDIYGYTFCRGRIFEINEIDHGQYNDEAEIFWASGAALIIRKDLYWQAGSLDEDFFAHMEEIDLCWRVHHLGKRILVMPQSVVYHVGGSSLKYGSYFKIYLNFRNNLVMLLKNLPSIKLFYILPIRLLLDFVHAARCLTLGDFKTIKAMFSAHWSFYKTFAYNFKKRKNIPHRNDISTIKKYSAVFAYFIQNKKVFSKMNR